MRWSYENVWLSIFSVSSLFLLRYNWHRTLISSVQHKDSTYLYKQNDHHNKISCYLLPHTATVASCDKNFYDPS